MTRPVIFWGGFIEEDHIQYIDLPRIPIKTVMLDYRYEPKLYDGQGNKIDDSFDAEVEIRGDRCILMQLPLRFFTRFYPPLDIDGRKFSRLEMEISKVRARMYVTAYIFEAEATKGFNRRSKNME